MNSQKMLLVGIVLFCYLSSAVWGVAVMSIDFGSEWMKVAVVSPGVPVKIALNKQSQRKTPVALSFKDADKHLVGEKAFTCGHFPEKVYMYLLNVIGKDIGNPLVDLYRKRFPYYDIKPTEDRESLIFKDPGGLEFTVEELVDTLFQYAQKIAEKAAGQPIKDTVITVPPFFNQAERMAMLEAAKISGLNVLQLLNSNTAVALNYGVNRIRDFDETGTNIMFYDMGASSTVATIVTYQLIKSEETGEIIPQLSIKGVGFSRILGGLEMQLRLRDYFAQKFTETKKPSSDIFENNKAMAKLFKEASRVKEVLSTKTEHVAQVESLLEDKDFKCFITRAEFEELCSHLFQYVSVPVEEALKSAQIKMSNIDQVILSGSGTRVPKVQQILLEYVKKEELGKSLNTDESAVLGAAYRAAYLSGFNVEKFLVKDANIYPMLVKYQKKYDNVKMKSEQMLFGRNEEIPLRKIMTIDRHVKHFEFAVIYGDLNFLSDYEIKSLGSLNVSIYGDSPIHIDGMTEKRGILFHFQMNESGILNLDKIQLVKETPEIDEESGESESDDFVLVEEPLSDVAMFQDVLISVVDKESEILKDLEQFERRAEDGGYSILQRKTTLTLEDHEKRIREVQRFFSEKNWYWLKCELDDAVFRSKFSELHKLINDFFERTKEPRYRFHAEANMDDVIRKWIYSSEGGYNSEKILCETVGNLEKKIKQLLNIFKERAEKQNKKKAKVNETARDSTEDSKETKKKTTEAEKKTKKDEL